MDPTPTKERRPTKGRATATHRGCLAGLSREQTETVMDWLEGVGEPPLSLIDAAVRAQKEFGTTTSSHSLHRFSRKHLATRRLLRAVGQSSGQAVLSAPQRARLRQAIKDGTLALASAIQAEMKPNETSQKLLAQLISTLDSCERTEILIQTHKLNERAQATREADLILRQREQSRKDDALTLERQKFDDMKARNDKGREALKTLQSKGGIPPEWARSVEDALCGIAPE